MYRQGVMALILGGCFALLPLVQCGFGEIVTEGEEGCPYGCPEGMVCLERACRDPNEGCDGVLCDPGYFCIAGTCRSDDPCDGVSCDPGYTCQGGTCVYGESDSDGDGFIAREDCDDQRPSVYPGALETCDGADEDCDGEIDEGFDLDRDGYTSCGSGVPGAADCDDDDPNVNPGVDEACNGEDDNCDGTIDEDIEPRVCSTACGEGEESCEGGDWVCTAPDACDCAPPETDTRDCGECGTQTRTCNGDNTWGDWGDCGGGGTCTPGAVDTQECGACGTQSRSCGADCTWGSWGTCTGGGTCTPGQIDTSACDDCTQRICSADCHWGPCDLRPTSECQWREGTNWRCCAAGSDEWQFCSSSCHWYPCDGCGSSCSC